MGAAANAISCASPVLDVNRIAPLRKGFLDAFTFTDLRVANASWPAELAKERCGMYELTNA
jgi:hypothetical protein